ncbi:MAG TPA: MBL fold metallo-hydrolase [Acidimicrobiales bacterium]|jgi:glyoxylase-like metal-dependent hydrolase (beta-lactamase superfamily II)|nr:MBL fold metallo-hydrolase [Acidimicrobiales bacterium]
MTVASAVQVGDLALVPLNDGLCKLPQEFYVGLDFAAHQELLADDGRVHIPIGCFLLRTGGITVLIDAGLGAVDVGWARGGALPAALRAAGASPEDVDVVVCSHLHIDHIGWLASDGVPFFPNATVRFGSADWAQFVDAPEGESRTREIMETLSSAGRLEPLDGDGVAIAPGLTARHTPGHTPGHYGLVVSSGTDRALLLGDAVECPLQLEEPDFYAMSDVDPDLAARTREALWRELEGSEALVTAAHFPGLQFGRVLSGRGRRYFSASSATEPRGRSGAPPRSVT